MEYFKTTMASDYYKILEVDTEASQSEIKKAYRKMAFDYHPDRNPDDPEAAATFKAASEAYDVLGDEEKRKIYDLYGEEGLKRTQRHDFRTSEDIFETFRDIFGNGSIFNDFFGQGGASRTSGKGRSLRVDIEVTLEDVETGTRKNVTLRKRDLCSHCKGSGAAPGTDPVTCSYCRGHGQVENRHGFFAMRTACPRCQGSGVIIKSPCTECGGAGLVQDVFDIKIDVPPGVGSGTRIKIPNEGEPNPETGLKGDLYCDIVVQEHPIFLRHGSNIICNLPLPYSLAALGGATEVPTLKAHMTEAKIPKGTQNNDIIRLKGLGLPDMHTGRRGDLLVKVFIEVPKRLTKRQKELLHELSEIEGSNVCQERQGFLDRLKDYVKNVAHPADV